MSVVTIIHAGGLAATGGAAMPWWLWVIAGALVGLGIVFVLLRRRGANEADEAAAPIIVAADPATGQGVGTTTTIGVVGAGEEAKGELFKPADTPPAEPADGAADSGTSQADGGAADPDAKQ